MPSEMDNTLEFNQYMKSDKMPYIIYAGIESLIRKIDRCANNPEKSSTTKISEHIFWGYLMSTIWAFDHIEKKTYFIPWKKLFEKVYCLFKTTRKKYN